MTEWNFDIEHVKQLGGTRFMGYAIHAHSTMIKDHQASDRHCNLHWENEGVFAVLKPNWPDPGEIVGMITFTDQKWGGHFSIGLGFVTRRFRSDGIYTSLWNRLVEIAQDRDVASISGTTYASNLPMRAVAKKHGRIEKAIVLEFDVPAKQSIG